MQTTSSAAAAISSATFLFLAATALSPSAADSGAASSILLFGADGVAFEGEITTMSSFLSPLAAAAEEDATGPSSFSSSSDALSALWGAIQVNY